MYPGSVLEARQAQLRECPPLSFALRGVTMGAERQKALNQVSQGTKVVLCRQRDNPVDPGAVSVFTLGGRDLGFMPKEATDLMAYEQSFGSIQSTRPVQLEDGSFILGATVTFRPALPPLAIEVLPKEITSSGKDRPLDLITPSQRTRLRKWAMTRTDCRCQVCGIECDPRMESPPTQYRKHALEPVLAEDFVLDDSTLTVFLRSVLVLCGRCYTARNDMTQLVSMRISIVDPRRRSDGDKFSASALDPRTREHVCVVNEWSERELGRYLYGAFTRWNLSKVRGGSRGAWSRQWTVDAMWLHDKLAADI